MSTKNNDKVKRIVVKSILLSVSMILSYIDSMLPFTFMNFGMKVGLSNIAIVTATILFGVKDGFIIGLLKVLILSVIFGNFLYFVISILAFLISFFSMSVVYYLLNSFCEKYKILIMSAIGGMTHNIVQVIVVYIYLKNNILLNLIPSFSVVGLLLGTMIGIIVNFILKIIRNYEIMR